MKPFDWERLLREQHIPYVDRGANVKRGEISIQCPYCGSADPSKHLGLNLETGWWSCWRNRAQHSGKSPLRLLMRLLNVPYHRAREIAGLDASYIDPEGFDAIAARILGRTKEPQVAPAERRFLDLDPQFLPITEKIRTRRHWDYLYERGFTGQDRRGILDVDRLCEQYNLRAGVRGLFGDRVILPYYQDGKLVTWSGRAIAKATIRYRDLDLEQSLLAPKQTLFNHDCLLDGGKVLVVQEGPFDALKVDFYGKRYGVRSVGLSTNSIKDDQAYLLQAAVTSFERIVIMLDTKSELGIADSMRMKQSLRFIPNLEIQSVPFGAGDAGNFTRRQAIQFAQTLRS